MNKRKEHATVVLQGYEGKKGILILNESKKSITNTTSENV